MMNITKHFLIDSACGIYAWHRLSLNYPLYIGSDKKLLTAADCFNPEQNDDWCDSIDQYERIGIFVQGVDGLFWSIYQSEHGDIWAINPNAVWDDEEGDYVIAD